MTFIKYNARVPDKSNKTIYKRSAQVEKLKREKKVKNKQKRNWTSRKLYAFGS